MGKKQKTEGEGGEAPAKKSRNLLPAVIIAVALLGAGALMGGKGGGSAAASDAAVASTTTTVAEGPVVSLEPITLNLADGRFLKVGLALQLSADAAAAGGGGGHGGGAAAEDPTAHWAKALDEAITVFGHATYEQLIHPEGRDEVKKELSHRVEERYHGEVLGVYFTEFVMQ